MANSVRRINPRGLPQLESVISHALVVEPAGLIYTSGQLSWDESGALVDGTMLEQFRRAYANLDLVLQAAGSSREKIVNEVIYLVGYSPETAGELVAALASERPPGSVPPTSTVVGVQTLFAPGFLVEVQVVATT
ncbi:putative endoribonuclease [Cupriavidus phytorum]|uniref:Endoribonuclease n=2 Tax=Cupriavidus TaxID=106589 RepID=A0A975XJ27_9BURK|nr:MULTISPECIES: RidA family protein [Cupriavidus]PZX34195.1 2-iminobutanoate/2-iminopropanoate deaminase [Cupriavidus alkaliphilus]SOY71922.1 putative endoribonuclease [Cupriavidus taiwanensis]